MFAYIRNSIYSPYFLSLTVAVIIILLLPPIFQKLKIEIVEDSLLEHKESIHYYKDLNNDGNTELIIAYGDSHGQFCFQVYDHLGGVAGQWNFPGECSRYTMELFFGDVNDNNILEIYGFTVHNDSVFLSAFEPLPDDRTLINFRFIDTFGTQGRQIDFNIPFLKVDDLENDKKKEIILCIAGGFSLTPRKIYRYDYLNDSIISSQSAGSIISEPIFYDLNNDGYIEITGSTNACENIPDTMDLPYKDHSSWLFIYDHKCQAIAQPLEFPGGGTRLFVSLMKCGRNTCIFGFHHSIGHESDASEFLLFNRYGKIVRQKEAPAYSKKDRFSIIKNQEYHDNILLMKQNGELWLVDSTLQVIRKDFLGIDINSVCYICDVNLDGKNEWLFKSADGTRLIISNPNLDILATIPTTELDGYNVSFYSHQDKPFLAIQDKKRKIILQCSPHPYYIKLTGSWILVYLGVLLFVLLIRKIQLQQIRAKEKIAAQILSLQLQSTSNQLDPHFTFNVFNTISALLQKSREISIHKSFMKFTELMRITLLSSGSITRSLADEITFVRDYLELEKFRFGEKFEYSIVTDEVTDLELPVPKMIIQVFAENAVKHGIFRKEGKGYIEIRITEKDDSLGIVVMDNGIGRVKAAEYTKESSGLGLKMIRQYMELFGKYKKFNINFDIKDLYDENGQASGTRIDISLIILS